MRTRLLPVTVLLLCLAGGPASQAEEALPGYARATPMDAYLPPPLVVLGESSDADVAALERLIGQYQEAWWAEDPEGLIATFAPDAQWTNAFGLVVRGHDEMRRFFPEMFKYFDARETSKSTAIFIRFLTEDTAIMQRVLHSAGGVQNRDADGVPARQIQVIDVFQRLEGDWKTVHQMIMDVRL